MRSALLLAGVFALLSAGCERESRRLQSPPEPEAGAVQTRTPGKDAPSTAPPNSGAGYERNAYELAEGKRLFRWFNCNGCHAQGGGNMGPPLMDGVWIYGSEPPNVYATIMEGRPNGMPPFRGRITEREARQLGAYVRSMSGLAAKDAAPGRNDGMKGVRPEGRRSPQTPSDVPKTEPRQ
jgi:cytochrome c oxidase cbb3-type subunit III